ncbi:LacI family transcriptional regulator [Flagellimonas sp. HMM57]|uniref:LacI family DNA-binding transcriptional regulator n=1 Tax=unclassified Flagellimonas TaxID=2644544 RepID=UPI0013D279F1|nr:MULTISPECIES: LacI family DNA-binding transcriptional regulator [unclassified Flagellimonas]UII75376.1 LacI family transcriptional regulator [Flagellimonas sp. HMM57]
MQKKVTIKDIAKELGITPSAVSKALSNHPRISNSTKASVIEMASKLNYQPNNLASALRKGKSNIVGVIVPRANSNFFSNVVERMEEVLNKKGYDVFITQSNESFIKECQNIDALLRTRVDGIIASLSIETKNLGYYKKIITSKVPLVMFDRVEDKLDVSYVGIDDRQSSHLVVEHLADQGYKRIAHIGGHGHIGIYKNRINGFIDALGRSGLQIHKELIVECGLTVDDGRKAMIELLNMPERPDAIYAAGDYAALGAMQVIQEYGIDIPREIAVVGFSDEPFTSLVSPSISTVGQHNAKIGRLAAEAFLRQMEKPVKNLDLNKTVLKPELIVRASSDRSAVKKA